MIVPWAAAALVAALSQTPAPAAPPPSPAVAPVPAPATAPDNPFSHLFKNLGTDLKALAVPETAWILGVGGTASLIAHSQYEQRVYEWVHERHPDSLSWNVGNFIGNGFVQAAGATIVWASGRAAQSVKTETVGVDLIRAQLVNGVLTQGLKITTQRKRPSGGGLSFPSGHVSASMATATVIRHHYGIVPAIPLYALSVGIGYARIRTDHHWVSDTVFGAAIGIVSARAATRYHAKKVTVIPVKTKGGAAPYIPRPW